MREKEILSRIFQLVKPYWPRLLFAMISMVAVAGLSALLLASGAEAADVAPLLNGVPAPDVRGGRGVVTSRSRPLV